MVNKQLINLDSLISPILHFVLLLPANFSPLPCKYSVADVIVMLTSTYNHKAEEDGRLCSSTLLLGTHDLLAAMDNSGESKH